MQNIASTIISQYANSGAICSSIDSENQAIDPATIIDRWYSNIWNVKTAVGYGLDVWGRIVGVSRVLNLSTDSYIGWDEAGDLTSDSWGNAIWYSGKDSTSNYALTDDAYRILIYAKALANISDGSIVSINRILEILFSDQGTAHVADNGNMTMTYVFGFVPSSVDVAIIENSGVLPRPSGVSVSYAIPS